MIDFIALDFETTGFMPPTAEIIEIGAVRYVGGAKAGEFASLVFPSRGVPPVVICKTGITLAMLATAPEPSHVMEEFTTFLAETTIIVAHQASFERKFLAVWTDVGRFTFIDTLRLARRALPALQNHRLATVAEALGIDVYRGHRALDDARVAGEIFLRLSAGGGELPLTEQ